MRRRNILLILFGFALLNSFAQPYSSTKGSFQVDQRRGCAPLTINLTQLISNTFTAEYNYEGGSNLTLSTSHIFNNPGTYTLLAVYNGLIPNSTDNMDNIIITVTENVQPAFEISTCGNSQVSIKVTDNRYNQYLVDFNNDNVVDRTILSGGNQTGTFQYASNANQTISVRGQDTNGADNCMRSTQTMTPLTTLPAATINSLSVIDASSIELSYTPNANIQYRGSVGTDNASTFQLFQSFNNSNNTQQTLTLGSIAPNDHYYCFILNSYDPCDNVNIPSNTICSAKLTVNFINDTNDLNWNTSIAGVNNFTIQRNQSNYQVSSSTNYSDVAPNITCNTDYCYSIITNYANGTSSYSNEKCGTSISNDTPSGIENTSTVFNGEELELEWTQDPAYIPKSYSVNRSRNNGPFNSIGSSSTQNYTDNTLSLSESYCYNINYLDACDNISDDGATVCPIILTGSLQSDNSINLSWNEYQGWKNGVAEYQVTKYNSGGSPIGTYSTSELTYLDDFYDPNNQIVSYIITAVPNETGISSSISNEVVITKQPRLIFPTAFTPNKDKLNDSFTIVGQYVDDMKLQIFDRWGTLIFSTETNEPWDGTQQGKLMPESVYIWKAFITDKTGKSLTRVGSVALLKN